MKKKRIESNVIVAFLVIVSLLGVLVSCDEDNFNLIGEQKFLVNELSLTPNGNIPLLVGRDTVLALSRSPEEVSNDKIIWYSSDEQVASVDETGKVTAKSTGKATITAESTDGGLRRATAIIEVIDQIIFTESIQIEPSPLTLFENVTEKLTVKFLPENTTYKHLRWSNSNPEIATIDEQGNVSAKSLGNTTITAYALDGSGVTATLTVTVEEAIVIEDILVAGTLNEVLGESENHLIDFSVLPAEASKQLVTWKSEDEGIVTVSAEGLITTVGYGETELVASAADGGGFSKRFTVKVEEGKINDIFRVGVTHRLKSSTNGASIEVKDNILWVTMNGDPTQPNPPNNRRGDFRREKTKVHVNNYPIVAFKFTRPLPTAGNIFLDTNLGRWRQSSGAGNNKMTILTGKDGLQVFYADFSEFNTFGNDNKTIPVDEVFTFDQMSVGVADFPNAQSPMSPYPVYWIKTFKSVAELEAYINQ